MFEIRIEGETAYLTGRLDAAESDQANAQIATLPGPITLDCAQLEYISSAGISVLMVAYKRMLAGGKGFRMVNLMPRVKNVFVYAGLDKLLGIE
jgi:anti-sigma B factor antagonist